MLTIQYGQNKNSFLSSKATGGHILQKPGTNPSSKEQIFYNKYFIVYLYLLIAEIAILRSKSTEYANLGKAGKVLPETFLFNRGAYLLSKCVQCLLSFSEANVNHIFSDPVSVKLYKKGWFIGKKKKGVHT